MLKVKFDEPLKEPPSLYCISVLAPPGLVAPPPPPPPPTFLNKPAWIILALEVSVRSVAFPATIIAPT